MAAKRVLQLLRHYVLNPNEGFTMAVAMGRGTFYILKYRVSSRGKIFIGFPFFCHTRIRICGKGRVRIGQGCSVFVNNFERLLIQTLTESAEVTIGRKCSLGGVTIRCAGRVEVGDHVMMAANLIQDVPCCTEIGANDFVGCDPSMLISIGDYVWLSTRSIVMRESKLGERSVLGVGAVLCGQSIGNGFLVLGNPARRPLPIASLMKIKASDA